MQHYSRVFQGGALVASAPFVWSCSDGAGAPNEKVHAESLAVTASAPPDAAVGDTPFAVSLQVDPWARCTVHPEGVTGDASRTATISADANGALRFYAPSHAWGTRLALDCAAGGQAQPSRTVDLEDASTFQRLAPADIAPRIVGTRPALTGDLSARSQDSLRSAGYPPRPDATGQPKVYEQWKEAVSKPFDKVEALATWDLEGSFQGAYEGGGDYIWSAMIQSANYFAPGGIAAFGSTYYTGYLVGMEAPAAICTASAGCFTGIWGGIGGYPEQFPFSGRATPSLIQSGFGARGSGMSQPFIEYWPAPPIWLPTPSGLYNVDDSFLVSGSADTGSDCQTPSTAGPWACFNFWDTTNNWMYSSPIPIQQPANAPFLAATMEYAEEFAGKNGVGNAYMYLVSNGNFVPVTMTGLAFDQNGNIHGDPGSSSGTDPYVATVQVDPSNRPYNNCNWSNGGVSVPVDPITFTFGNTN